MPAKSQAQRGYLAHKFGVAWMRRHHFANKGKLPARKHKHKMSDLSETINFAELPAAGSSLERISGMWKRNLQHGVPPLGDTQKFWDDRFAVKKLTGGQPYWKSNTTGYERGMSGLVTRDNPNYQGSIDAGSPKLGSAGWLARKRPIGTLQNTSTQSLFMNSSKLVRLAQIDKNLDSVIKFQYEDDQDQRRKFPWLATGAAAGVGAVGVLGHQAIKRTGGYGANLMAMRYGPDLLGKATGNVAANVGNIGSKLSPAYKASASAVGAGKDALANLLKRFRLESKEKPIEFQGGVEEAGAGLENFIRHNVKANQLSPEAIASAQKWGRRLGKGVLAGGAIGAGLLAGRYLFPKQNKQQPEYRNSQYNSASKPIEFKASIVGPWVGSKGHESKIDQLEFPAGLSPAAALKFPLPKLMRYMNRRNQYQQVFSRKHERLIELNAKFDEIQLGTAKGIAIGAGATLGAAGVGYGGYKAVGALKEHNRKMRHWRKNAGDEDFLPLAKDLVIDRHGAMYPTDHPRVQTGNISSLKSRLKEIQFREDRSGKTWEGAAVAGGIGVGGYGTYRGVKAINPTARYIAGKSASRTAVEREVVKMAKRPGPISWRETGQLYKRAGTAFYKGARHARLSAKIDDLIQLEVMKSNG